MIGYTLLIVSIGFLGGILFNKFVNPDVPREKPKKNQIIASFRTHGGQAQTDFEWVGKISDISKKSVFVDVIKYNHSYTDSRDGTTIQEKLPKAYFKYKDAQWVNGIWILTK